MYVCIRYLILEMKTVYHKANSRGYANHGWLVTHHSFSFAGYYNSERVNFGALRVLNDDAVKGGSGFSAHPHYDMEIISIPLSGTLQHADNMGNRGTIAKGEVQVMSAGTGITHSEKNADNREEVKFLQIWIIPREQGVKPRYGQLTISSQAKPNDFQQIVSPNKKEEGLWIHQDAWLHIANFDKGVSKEYKVKKAGNGVYVFAIEGKAKIGTQILDRRDGFGIYDIDSFTISAEEKGEFLLIEVPMVLPE